MPEDSDFPIVQSEEMLQEAQMWRDAFSNTSEEEWKRLQKIFLEDEAEGTLPLDFTGR